MNYPTTLKATQSDGEMEKRTASIVSDRKEERCMRTLGICKSQASCPFVPSFPGCGALRTCETPYFGRPRFASWSLRASNCNDNGFFSGLPSLSPFSSSSKQFQASEVQWLACAIWLKDTVLALPSLEKDQSQGLPVALYLRNCAALWTKYLKFIGCALCIRLKAVVILSSCPSSSTEIWGLPSIPPMLPTVPPPQHTHQFFPTEILPTVRVESHPFQTCSSRCCSSC